MLHGSPRRNNEDIMPDTPLKEVEEMLSGVDANIILCGNTHIPCGFQTDTGQTVVNDGSVGRPFTDNPEACYAIISTTGDGGYEVFMDMLARLCSRRWKKPVFCFPKGPIWTKYLFGPCIAPCGWRSEKCKDVA